jgi:hypothetical protein
VVFIKPILLFLDIIIPMVESVFDTSIAIVRYWRFDFDLKG